MTDKEEWQIVNPKDAKDYKWVDKDFFPPMRTKNDEAEYQRERQTKSGYKGKGLLDELEKLLKTKVH